MNDEAKLVRGELEAKTIETIPAPPHYLRWGEAPREPDLHDYLIILRKHQWLILFILLTVVTIVTIVSFRMTPVYVAVARVEIERENSYFLPFQAMAPEALYPDMGRYIETRARVLEGETLALQTIESLHLETHPEFASPDGTETQQVSPNIGEAPVRSKPAIVDDFLARLSVTSQRNSHLLEVAFEAKDPRLAARVVNAHLENFMEHNFRTRYESMVQVTNWLSTQVEELKIKVEKSEDALVAYERENQIWAIDEKQNITTQKLADLNRELTVAQSDRMRKEAAYQLARSGNTEGIPAVRDSEVIRNLLKRRAELKDRHAEALNQFGPKYPKVLRLEAQLRDLDLTLQREKQNVVERIESEYRAAGQREALLSEALERQKTKANDLAQKLVQYNILRREAETNKELYEGLLQRIKEAGIAAGLRSSNIRVVDPALVPSAPARPRKVLNIALAVVLGLVGGVGLAFLREYLDSTVRTPDDVKGLARLPPLAVVPAFATRNGRTRLPELPKLLRNPSRDLGESAVEWIVHKRPQSQISEAFRSLRTSLLLSQAGHPPQVILVTSPLPGEGKTTTALNLALTLAQLGNRALVLDADLRKPAIGGLLGLPEKEQVGLSNYLAGTCALDSLIVSHPTVANLAAIPSGPIPPDPAELLSSGRLRAAIDSLRSQYKFIVLDSPPVLSATDAVILSVLTDCVLLVVRSGVTPKEAFTRTSDLLAEVNCRLLGVVLNAVDFSSAYYSYSYRYYPYSPGEEVSRNSRI